MMLDAEVKYEANDSMRFDFEHKKMYLYGDAKIDYGEISLTAYAIELDMGCRVSVMLRVPPNQSFPRGSGWNPTI